MLNNIQQIFYAFCTNISHFVGLCALFYLRFAQYLTRLCHTFLKKEKHHHGICQHKSRTTRKSAVQSNDCIVCFKDISTDIVSDDSSTPMMMLVMMKLEALNRSLTSAQHSLFLDDLLSRQRALLLLEGFERLKRLHQLLHGGHFYRSTGLDRV